MNDLQGRGEGRFLAFSRCFMRTRYFRMTYAKMGYISPLQESFPSGGHSVLPHSFGAAWEPLERSSDVPASRQTSFRKHLSRDSQ